MKYNKKAFDSAVALYKKELNFMKGKEMLVLMGLDDEKAYCSIAPLSRAIHEKGGEIHVILSDEEGGNVEVLFDAWEISAMQKEGRKTSAVKALADFISEVEKKAGKGKFSKIFNPPDYIIRADKEFFIGNIRLPYRHEWFRKYRWPELLKTADIIWGQVYNLKKSERVGCGFETIAKKIRMPLEDYLDSYAIARAMALSAKKKCKRVSMQTSSSKDSMLVPMERIGDLRATLFGCELSKDINEAVFKKFLMLRKYIKSARMRPNDATFFIAGSRYPGKHLFGQAIGYPSPNRKTRWQSPAQILFQLDYAPQTKADSRPPRSRLGFTDTLPIDVFIKTSKIDWFEMKRKNDALRRIAAKSRKIIVCSDKNSKHKTDFVVGLVKKDGSFRTPRNSDIETRSKINRDYLKRKGIKAGTMANIPGGEMFVTPEYVKGTFAGDVVINVDKSYRLSAKSPLVIKSDEKGYRIKSGPKNIIAAIKKRKNEAMKQLLEQEKNKSLPKNIIRMKKQNFNKIGEFAINTNPKAELTDYLIVNEKISGMIHLALGSGFEEDRATVYHYDIVIDAKKQMLDIYGVGEKGEKHWAMKKGKLLV